MRKDRESRKLVLDIVDRIHEMRYWEKQQEERATPAPSKPLWTHDQGRASRRDAAPSPRSGPRHSAQDYPGAAGARPVSLSPGSDGSGADPHRCSPAILPEPCHAEAVWNCASRSVRHDCTHGTVRARSSSLVRSVPSVFVARSSEIEHSEKAVLNFPNLLHYRQTGSQRRLLFIE